MVLDVHGNLQVLQSLGTAPVSSDLRVAVLRLPCLISGLSPEWPSHPRPLPEGSHDQPADKEMGSDFGPSRQVAGQRWEGRDVLQCYFPVGKQRARKHTTSSDSDTKVLSPGPLTEGSGAFFVPSLNLCGLSWWLRQ